MTPTQIMNFTSEVARLLSDKGLPKPKYKAKRIDGLWMSVINVKHAAEGVDWVSYNSDKGYETRKLSNAAAAKAALAGLCHHFEIVFWDLNCAYMLIERKETEDALHAIHIATWERNHLKQENDMLYSEVEAMKKKVGQYKELVEENNCLKATLGMAETENEKLKARQSIHEQLIRENELLKKKVENYQEVVDDNLALTYILELTEKEIDRLKGK